MTIPKYVTFTKLVFTMQHTHRNSKFITLPTDKSKNIVRDMTIPKYVAFTILVFTMQHTHGNSKFITLPK